MQNAYIAIDLKSFYASVECVERGLDPLKTNLVVADASRTEKTICLAVSPSLKAHGIPGRARLFEVVQKVREANALRQCKAPGRVFQGKSSDADALAQHPEYEIDYLIAQPQMAHYMDFSARIYGIYLKFVAPEDIHVYSVDEVFINAAPYLKTYGVTVRGFAQLLIQEVMRSTGITATAGIGTNLYLCKVAMDIVAKHTQPDENGVRIAELNEQSYRELLWNHRPLTDFWRVGPGYAAKLEKNGMHTMGDIARCSLGDRNSFWNEDLLYDLFGVNAELLIDHAWGYEPCTIAHIKSYKPSANSMSNGQVLSRPYSAEEARLVACEMADQMAMRLVSHGLITSQLTLTVCYDIDNLKEHRSSEKYQGDTATDRYGRKVPKPAKGTANLSCRMSSSKRIMEAIANLYDAIVNPDLLVRRIYISANSLVGEESAASESAPMQLDLFADNTAKEREQEQLAKERKQQKAMLKIKQRFGKNAVVRGMDLLEAATSIQRNAQIGGHKA